jgi:hypothetical protein
MTEQPTRSDDQDPLRRWPSPGHSPGTFEGQMEQLGKMTTGLRSPRAGWRRLVGRVGLAALLLAALVIMFMILSGNR